MSVQDNTPDPVSRVGRRLATWITIGLGLAIANRACDSIQDTFREAGRKRPDFPDIVYLGGKKPTFFNIYYEQNGSERSKVVLNDPVSKEFYKSWKELAIKNAPTTSGSNYNTWDLRRQQDYLVSIQRLAGEMPRYCNGRLGSCSKTDPYYQKVDLLHQQYRMSPELIVSEIENLERFYVAALTDRELTNGLRNFSPLSVDQRLALSRRMIGHEFRAYTVARNKLLPETVVQAFSKQEDSNADADSLPSQNIVRYNQDRFYKFSSADFARITIHEGRHLIGEDYRKQLDTEVGRASLRAQGISTEMQIDKIDMEHLYMLAGKNREHSDGYTEQIEESISIFAGYVGTMVAYRISWLDDLNNVTPQQARDYFYTDMFNYRVFHPFIASQSLQSLFLEQWKANAEICTTKDNNSGIDCERPPDSFLRAEALQPKSRLN